MTALFYTSGIIAVIAALLMVTRANAMHALINLIISFIAIGAVFFSLGAPFAAVLQIVVYAGAIMVLFVFVVMMLNLGREAERQERSLLSASTLAVPVLLALALLIVFVAALLGADTGGAGLRSEPREVGQSLYTVYLIGVEIASVLLLAALVAAFHYGAFMGRLRDKDE